jgi:hypothetical protein
LTNNFAGIIAFKRKKGLVIHHSFVNRFCREKVLRKKLYPNFDDGLLTCGGFSFVVLVIAVSFLLNTF